jgi:hypothetical protein
LKPFDVVKAALFALIIVILDVLIGVGAVFAWGVFLEPGQTQHFYATAGVAVARLSTRIVGSALLFAAAWFLGRRHPERNPYLFGAMLVFFYALLDGASMAFSGFFSWNMGLTLMLKLAAALAGAWLASREFARRLSDSAARTASPT